MYIDDINVVLVGAAVLLLVAILASKLSDRLGIPALLLFLGTGMLAGSEGIGGIEFEDYELAQGVGVVALAFILFSGGFDTRTTDVRPQAGRGLLLATVGVLATALIVGLAGSLVLGVSVGTGLLFGAIVSSTDAAAVFAVLRSRAVGLRHEIRPLLELESGSNDPMAVFLTLACIELLVDHDAVWWQLIALFVMQMAIGAGVGLVLGRGATVLVNRLRLMHDGLYPVVLIAVVLGVYGAAAMLGGSGFLAVYLAGMVMGNRQMVHRRSLARFGDALAWLMQIAMFLVLGLLVFPSALLDAALPALALSTVLIFVARPIAVAAALVPTRFGVRPTAMVAWTGLRGAVPIILATFPLVRGVEHADTVFNVVFFVVLSSVALQGTTVPLVARWLRVDEPEVAATRSLGDLDDVIDGAHELRQLRIESGSPAIGEQIVDLDLPRDALIVLVSRDQQHLVPQGSTTLEARDRLMVLCDHDRFGEIHARFGGDGS